MSIYVVCVYMLYVWYYLCVCVCEYMCVYKCDVSASVVHVVYLCVLFEYVCLCVVCMNIYLWCGSTETHQNCC